MRRRNFLSTILIISATLSTDVFSSSYATGIPEPSQACQIREMQKAFKKQIVGLTADNAKLYYYEPGNFVHDVWRLNDVSHYIRSISYNKNKMTAEFIELTKKFKFVGFRHENHTSVIPILTLKNVKLEGKPVIVHFNVAIYDRTRETDPNISFNIVRCKIVEEWHKSFKVKIGNDKYKQIDKRFIHWEYASDLMS